MNIYALYQTDAQQSYENYVCFGYFDDKNEAIGEAEANGLIVWVADNGYFSVDENTKVIIEEYTLNEYGERNGIVVADFEHVELNDCEECGTLCVNGDITFVEDETTLYFCSDECKGDYVHRLKHEDD